MKELTDLIEKRQEELAEKAREYSRQSYLVSEENHPVEDEMKAWDDLLEAHRKDMTLAFEAGQKAEREKIIREVNSFSQRYPEYGVRLYEWEDGTLGMDTISFHDAVNNKQGDFMPYLYKENTPPTPEDLSASEVISK